MSRPTNPSQHSWPDNYHRMIRRNRATGYAIYHCLLQAYRMHSAKFDLSGITDRDITQISEKLLVSERWVRHVLGKYQLFYVVLDAYYPKEGWEDAETDI